MRHSRWFAPSSVRWPIQAFFLAEWRVTSVTERTHKGILLPLCYSYTHPQKEPLMKRSIGVTFSAIVSLLGSALTLGCGVLVIFILFFFAPTQANFSGVSSAPKVAPSAA